jgi:DNA-binding transcriptional LysR family regulator
MLDWNDLRYFLAVAREGSTLAASKSLGVSQPTVQRRLAALEKQAGRSLVERHPTGYRLTDVGKSLVPFAARIEENVTELERHLTSSDQSLAGVIRVTCPEADIAHLLAPIFDRFHTKYPKLHLEFILTDRKLDLAKGEADIALRGGKPGDDVLVGRKIVDTPWALYASRDYVERRGKPERSEDLDRHAIIAYTGPMKSLRCVRWLHAAAPNAPTAAYSNSVLGALAAAKTGTGLALLPIHIANTEPDLLCALELPPEFTEPVTLMVHPDLRNTPRIRAFIDFFFSEIRAVRSLFRNDTPGD